MVGIEFPRIPYDSTFPVFYDNDDHRDVYTDEYLIALASAGSIELIGMSTTYPAKTDAMAAEYREFVAGRREIVERARRSGLRDLPDPIPGADRVLLEPASRKVEDTAPLHSAPAKFLVEKAHGLPAGKRIVVITGGPLTTPADAYLIWPGIADRIVVASLLGTPVDTSRWNGCLDAWATYIVATRLTYVQFPTDIGAPRVPKNELARLPDNELTQWMRAKAHPHNGLPGDRDEDGQPAVALMRPEYVHGVRRCRVADFDAGVCRFGDDPEGNVFLVTGCDGDGIGTTEFFRALRNPEAYR